MKHFLNGLKKGLKSLRQKERVITLPNPSESDSDSDFVPEENMDDNNAVMGLVKWARKVCTNPCMEDSTYKHFLELFISLMYTGTGEFISETHTNVL
jgi:hypothetical protein